MQEVRELEHIVPSISRFSRGAREPYRKNNHKNLFYYNKYCEIYFNHKIHLKFLSEFSGAQMKMRLFVFVAMAAAAEAHLFTRINASARKDNKNEILYSDYV